MFAVKKVVQRSSSALCARSVRLGASSMPGSSAMIHGSMKHQSLRCFSSHPGILHPPLGMSGIKMSMNEIDPRCSVLCELPDKPGALFVLLSFFWKHEVQLTAIESRPVTGSDATMTIQLSFAGSREDPIIQKLVNDMSKKCRSILVLDEKVCTGMFVLLFICLF